jgi:hypothetical protein
MTPSAELIRADDPLAVETVEAIRGGDVTRLQRLLRDHPRLAGARIADPRCDDTRSLLHVATDFPGHFPNGPATVRTLVAAGTDVNARGGGQITETPLHWAASSDDVAVLEALLQAGADIDADVRSRGRPSGPGCRASGGGSARRARWTEARPRLRHRCGRSARRRSRPRRRRR